MNVNHERLVKKKNWKVLCTVLKHSFFFLLLLCCVVLCCLFVFIRNFTSSLRSLACAADETKLCRLSPFAKQHRNPCCGPRAWYQDLSKRHDWPMKNAIVDLPNKMTAQGVNI